MKKMGVSSLIDSAVYRAIERDVEVFVKEQLKEYKPQKAGNKTIRDSVWGSVEYSNWEMQLIDSPLFQRLRSISQVGLAYLTYPAARHTRFEHSLGVLAAAKRMCEKLSKDTLSDFKFKQEYMDKVYLAALLHDVGHCFYSHLSETIYGEFDDFVALTDGFVREIERKPKPHEILAFIIVNTESFKTFFENHISYPRESNYNVSNLFHDVGRIIVGAYIERDNVSLSCLTSIVNGPFDADKLDYIKRDSLTTGLSLSYDVERLLTKIHIHVLRGENNKTEYRLVIQFNGITALEELTFCKIMLHSYIYYHQKVLTSEIMIKDYIRGLYNLGILKNYADFLHHTDASILDIAERQNGANPFPKYSNIDLVGLSNDIKTRRLPKRCFELSYTNVESTEKDEICAESIRTQCQRIISECSASRMSVDDLIKEASILASIIARENSVPLDTLISEFIELTYDELLDKRNDFYLRLTEVYSKKNKPVDFTLFDIYIAFPKHVNYGSSSEKIVLGKDKKGLLTINDFVKLDDWAESFNSNKWRAYIFVSDKIDKTIALEVAQMFILKGKARIKNPTAYIRDIITD